MHRGSDKIRLAELLISLLHFDPSEKKTDKKVDERGESQSDIRRWDNGRRPVKVVESSAGRFRSPPHDPITSDGLGCIMQLGAFLSLALCSSME